MKRREKKEATMTFDDKLGEIWNRTLDEVDYIDYTKFKQSILKAIAEELPKEIHKFDDDYENGFNNCLSEVRKRLGIK